MKNKSSTSASCLLNILSSARLRYWYANEAPCAEESKSASVLGVPALRDARVTDYVVETDVAARLHSVGGEEKGHARHILHSVSPFVQKEALCTEAAFVTKQEAERCRPSWSDKRKKRDRIIESNNRN